MQGLDAGEVLVVTGVIGALLMFGRPKTPGGATQFSFEVFVKDPLPRFLLSRSYLQSKPYTKQ